jgi:hypothetical protein
MNKQNKKIKTKQKMSTMQAVARKAGRNCWRQLVSTKMKANDPSVSRFERGRGQLQ